MKFAIYFSLCLIFAALACIAEYYENTSGKLICLGISALAASIGIVHELRTEDEE